MLDAIAGYDDSDPASLDAPLSNYARAIHQPVSKLRVAIVRAPFFEGLDPEVQKATEAAVDVLRQHVTSVADVTLPPSAGLALIGPEAYAYHSKWITDSPALYQAATRAILERSAPPGRQESILERGLADNSYHAGAAGHDRTEQNAERAYPQHSAVRRFRVADDLVALRLYEFRPARRPSNQRGAVRGNHRAGVISCLRTGHRLAYSPAHP